MEFDMCLSAQEKTDQIQVKQCNYLRDGKCIWARQQSELHSFVGNLYVYFYVLVKVYQLVTGDKRQRLDTQSHTGAGQEERRGCSG